MKVDLNKQCWQNIRVRNTSLYRANFVKCNLSGSEFENVDMVGVNLNRAILFNCKWTNIYVDELHDLQEGKTKLVCFSPDCITLASYRNSFRLWNIKTAKTYKQFKVSKYLVSLCFSPDGATLVGNSNRVILLIDVRKGKIQYQINHNLGYPSQSSISPDQSFLAIGSSDKSVNLWDLKNREIKSKLLKHTKPVIFVGFSIDGEMLVSGGLDDFIYLWNLKTGKLKQQLPISGGLSQISFSSDGIWFATEGFGRSLYIWNLQTGELKQSIYCRENDMDRRISIRLSPDGTTIASCCSLKLVFLYIPTKTELYKVDGGGHSISFSPDSTILAAATWETIKLLDVNQCVKAAKLKQNGHSDKIYIVCFSPDGTLLASSSGSSSVYIWDVKTGELKLSLNEHKYHVYQISFSPDGTTLASSDNLFIYFWDVRTGKLLFNVANEVNLICQSTDSNRLAYCQDCQEHYQICILDLKSRETISEITGQIVTKNPLSFSPDCTTFASENQDHSIEIWDMNTRELKLQLKGHNEEIDSVQVQIHIVL